MNDAFIFAVIQFIEGVYVKRLSNEAKVKIIAPRAYFIQFKIYTYLQVVGASVNPKKLPKYPSDKLVLLKISW